MPGGSWNNPLQFPSLPYVPIGTGALAVPLQQPLQDKHKTQVPPSEGGTVKQTDVPRFKRATNSKVAGVHQATHGSKSKQDNHGNNGVMVMAAAKPRRKSTGALGQQTLTGGYITIYNGNKPITPSMLKKTLSELPEGFQYPRHFRKKEGVVGNKSISDTSVLAAPKCKVMFVHSICNDTTDDDMK